MDCPGLSIFPAGGMSSFLSYFSAVMSVIFAYIGMGIVLRWGFHLVLSLLYLFVFSSIDIVFIFLLLIASSAFCIYIHFFSYITEFLWGRRFRAVIYSFSLVLYCT